MRKLYTRDVSQSEIFIKILLTIVFGSVLGLETETREIENVGIKMAEKFERQRIGGVRTYTVLSLFGGVAGLLFNVGQNVLVDILFATIILLVISAYILNVQFKKAFGMTTEIAIVITFTLGFLTTSSLIPLSAILAVLVLLSFFLSQKRGIGTVIHKIQHKEVIDIISFGLISLVILPLLPDKDFVLGDLLYLFGVNSSKLGSLSRFVVINPFQIWLLVVLISGLNLIGYFLSKFIGKVNGLYLVGIFGGIISSTSTIITLAQKVKADDEDHTDIYAGVSLIANAISFVEIIIVLYISSSLFFHQLFLVVLSVLISGLLVGGYFVYRYRNKEVVKKVEDLSIEYEAFSIMPAVKYVLMVLVVQFFIQIIQLISLPSIFILLSSIAGVTGVSSSTLALSNLVKTGDITLTFGVITFLLLNLVNFIAKVFYAYRMGNNRLGNKILIGLTVSGMVALFIYIFNS